MPPPYTTPSLFFLQTPPTLCHDFFSDATVVSSGQVVWYKRLLRRKQHTASCREWTRVPGGFGRTCVDLSSSARSIPWVWTCVSFPRSGDRQNLRRSDPGPHVSTPPTESPAGSQRPRRFRRSKPDALVLVSWSVWYRQVSGEQSAVRCDQCRATHAIGHLFFRHVRVVCFRHS